MTNDIPTMLTLKEAASKTGLAVHYLRQSCLNNKIVHIRCGKRILINGDKLIEFLNIGDQTVEPEPQNKIRRLA